MKTNIYGKIAMVMKQIERIPKRGYNDFHKYSYVLEADLLDNIRPILLEAGLVLFPNILEQERNGEFTKVKVEFTLADIETGETLKSVFWGEGQDKGDKGLYKAYTGATKYFLMKTFLIPTGDDPETEPTPQPPRGRQPQQQTARNQAQAKPQQQQVRTATAKPVAQAQQQPERNLDAWKALAKENHQQQPKKEQPQEDPDKPRRQYFAMTKNKLNLSKDESLNLCFYFTGKGIESHGELEIDDYKEINKAIIDAVEKVGRDWEKARETVIKWVEEGEKAKASFAQKSA